MAAQVGDAELSILAPSGAEIAKLPVDAGLSAGKIKELLEAQYGYPRSAQQLVDKESLLPDECVLASIWESAPPPYSLVLVVLPFSRWDALGHAAEHGRVAVVRKLMHGYGKIGTMREGEEEAEEAAEEAACGRGVADALRLSIRHHQMAAFTEILVALVEFPAPQQAAALHQAWQPDTLLHVAIMSGHVDMVEKVLALSLPPGALSVADSRGLPPLHLAAFEGSDDVFRAVLVALAAAQPSLLLQHAPARELTALHFLLAKGRHAVVEEFLEAVDKEHGSAVGHEEEDRTLLSASAVSAAGDALRSKLLFARSTTGCTPLHSAAWVGGEFVVPKISDMVTPQELHRLLTTRALWHCTPLHCAAIKGHKALACELLAASSPQQRLQLLAATCYWGNTPVHTAAARDQPHVLRELLVHAPPGAQLALLRAKNMDGCNPLHRALENGHEAAVRVLLEVAAELGEGLPTWSSGGLIDATPIERDVVADTILEMKPRLLESLEVRRRGMFVWLQYMRMLCRLQLQGTLAGFHSAAAGNGAWFGRCSCLAGDVYTYSLGLGSGPAAVALSLWLPHLGNGSPADVLVLTAVATWLRVHVATWLFLGAGCLRGLLLRRGSVVYSPLPLRICRHLTRRWFRASLPPLPEHDHDVTALGVVELQLEELWENFCLYFPGCKELLRLLSEACCLVSLCVLNGACRMRDMRKQAPHDYRRYALCISPFVAMPLLVSLLCVSAGLGMLLGLSFAATSPIISIYFLLIATHQLMKDMHACFQQAWQGCQDRRHRSRRPSEAGRQDVTIGRSADTWKDDEDEEHV